MQEITKTQLISAKRLRRFRSAPPVRRDRGEPGFALVITISLLVLLALVAVGILTLSTITVRTASQGAAQAEARANARLALILAVGQLQKAVGSDQRITAPASLRDRDATPALTGVWESFPLNPEGYAGLDDAKQSAQSDEEANGEFVGWLSSHGIGETPKIDPPDTSPGPGRATLLRSANSDPDVAAEVLDVGTRGGLAWMTIDEGVKARFDLPHVEPADEQAQLARLRAPERPAVDASDAFENFVPDEEEAARIATYRQGELAATDRSAYKEGFHDFTVWSNGLATNVVKGGLKGDLTLAFEQSQLPAGLKDRHVYSDRENTPLAECDPRFSTLADYYRLYQDRPQADTPLQVTTPTGYAPSKRDRNAPTMVPNLQSLDGSVIAPVVTRVNVVFSLVSREAHGHWINTIPNRSGDPRRTFMVYLIYTPVVTLYNPYTAPITVDNLKTTFRYLPLAFQFYRNGRPQTSRPALLSQFHISSQNNADWEDKFTATLSGPTRSSRATPVTLQPGEARVFGVNHPPGTRWGQMTNYLWQNDLHLSKTLNITTAEGWNYNSGFIVDWLAPNAAGRTADNSNLGVFGVRGNDTIDVAITPQVPTYRGRPMDYFGVEIEARVNRRPLQLGNYRYRYGTRDRLIEAMEGGAHPSIGKIQFPVRREKPWAVNQLYQRSVESVPVERWTGPKQFAIFTLADRTAEDSLYPTKPGLDTSFVHQVLDMDITETHPAQMPMELSFLPITGQGANTVGSLEVFSADDPRSFFFSGWRLLTGLTNYPTYQVPRSPLVNIADLRHANLASSGHLPLPAYTVGSSRAHPLIPVGTALERNTALGSELADHSWLANNALWDGYYFSGIRNEKELGTFFDGDGLPLHPRMRPHLPNRVSRDTAEKKLLDEDGWRSTAAYQLQRGTFNVHSTSVEAWKIILSALREKEVPLVNPVTAATDKELAIGSPFPRLLDGAAGRIDNGENATNQERWAGFRDLTDEEIAALAEEIVEGIRERGPFLSMSEFLNRRLDGDPETTALAGILEEAIAHAGINTKAAPLISRLVTDQDAADFEYANKAVAVGDTQEGAGAFLGQGDVLSAIGSSLAVRSDTFVVRASGESRDGNGQVVATALCEAVIQRVPEFTDPTDPVDAVPANSQGSGGQDKRPTLSDLNERFGRQLRIVSFRWIPTGEV